MSGLGPSDYESEIKTRPVCIVCGLQNCNIHNNFISTGIYNTILTTGLSNYRNTNKQSMVSGIYYPDEYYKLYWDENNQSWKDMYGNIIPDTNVINRNKHRQLISDYIRAQDITCDRININDANISYPNYDNEFPELKLSEDPTLSYDKSYSTFGESKLNIDFYSAWEKLKEIPLNKKIRNNTIFVLILIGVALAIKMLYSL